ncbi:MAG: DNA-binding protein YbiB [Rhodocyclaceae bacterium]|nr:DNA-binding protein YbiB [Rhodocyclaceae bacterium]
MSQYAAFIKEIGRGAKGARSLDRGRAQTLFADMLAGRVAELELGAILIALRIKSESLDELLGFSDAMREAACPVAVPEGPRCVVLPTYNGARRQPNLMPLVARLLARRGIPVLIQGRHDFETRVDPFALLAALDLPCQHDTAAASQRLAAGEPACLPLDALLPGLSHLLATRLRLGVRSAGHTMAKLLDPAPGRSVRVVAVTHPEYLERMDEFLLAEGGHAQLLRGTEGEIYANPRRRPRLVSYAGGTRHVAFPAEEGGAPPLPDLPGGHDVAANAATIRDMLDGSLPIPGPILDQVEALVALAES